jgi:hypothetical protein
MGAHFRISIVTMSWEKIRKACAGLRVCLADMKRSVPYDKVNWAEGAWALIRLQRSARRE